MAILTESNSKTLEELKAEFDEFLSSISDDIYGKEVRKVHGKSATIDKVGDLPYLCFNFFRSEDKETYDKLTKPLCQDPEADPLSIRYNIGYYNSVENIRVNLFFDDIASQADWGFKKAFKINNHYYFIHNKSFHANNLLQFARYIYVESDGKYLVKLSDNFPEEPSVGLWLVSEKKQKRSSKAVHEVEETDAEIDKYDIFVSYSRADYNLVYPLVKEIEDMGVKVWFDMNGIESGDAFKKKIMKAIENSDSLLFMYSENAINGEYTEKEVNYANILEKKIRPVLINGIMPQTGWFAFDYGHLDIINIQNHLQKEKLLKNLRDAYCNAEVPQVVRNTKKHETSSKLYLKVKPNKDCIVVIDDEECGEALANKVTKLPLRPGEYTLACIAKDNKEKWENDDISIKEYDVLVKPVFPTKPKNTGVKKTPNNIYYNGASHNFSSAPIEYRFESIAKDDKEIWRNDGISMEDIGMLVKPVFPTKYINQYTNVKEIDHNNVSFNELKPYLPEYIYFPMSDAPAMYFQKKGSEYRLEKGSYSDLFKAYSKMSEPEKKLLSTGKSIGKAGGNGLVAMGLVGVGLAVAALPVAASLSLSGIALNLMWDKFNPFKDKYEELDQKVKVMCDSIGLVVKVTEKYYILDVFRSPENRAYLAERCMPAIWPDNK